VVKALSPAAVGAQEHRQTMKSLLALAG